MNSVLVVHVLAAVRLNPKLSAVQHVSLAGRTVAVLAPSDDEVMEAVMASAHAAAAADPDRYDEVMEERCCELLADRPANWAQVWPSAVAAGERVLSEPKLVAGQRVLELGAGLGFASVCAALAGASEVVATDREPDAALYAAANAAENTCTVQTRTSDWSHGWQHGEYDVVLAADIIYDESAPPLLAKVLEKAVRPGGIVLLFDNADRPYKDARRSALLELLCSSTEESAAAGAPLFAIERTERTTIALATRQGDSFEVAECVLRRII
jgi:predicted nicotinamide N-methyase